MKWTNKRNLPQTYYDAVVRASHVVKGEMSVTQLLMSPQQFQLLKRHDNEITQDVSDWNNVTAFLGTSVHTALAKHASKEAVAEKVMTMEVAGWKISGTPDHVEKGLLTDYKVSSVWSLILGGKDDWADQLQLYAHLCRVNGVEVKRGCNVMWLRDWMQSRSKKEADYPQYGIHTLNLDKLWPEAQVTEFIEHRVKMHQEAAELNDANLIGCTDKERWVRGEKWAVMKGKNKKATVLCKTSGEASNRVIELGAGHRVEHRAGVAARCDDWCSAREFCHQVVHKEG